jgi:hypothetical protein
MTDRTNSNMKPNSSINPSSRVKAAVMRRVRTVHAMQQFFTTTTLSVAVFVLALWGIGREVWVARVFQNMPSLTNLSAVANFYLAAFLDTRFIVQVLSVVTLGAFVWLTYNVFRLLRGVTRFA